MIRKKAQKKAKNRNPAHDIKKPVSSRKISAVLSVGDEGAILTCGSGKNMICRMFFSSPFSDEFKNFLAPYPLATISILVDTIDQAYITHDLPPVSAQNAKKLANRKLNKDFDKGDLKAAIPLGKRNKENKSWQYLFVSARNVPPLSDWIDAVADMPNPFGGVYLLPIESPPFLDALYKDTKAIKGADKKADKNKSPSQWQIIVSHNRVGGFRQIVFKNHKLLFTRIAQPIGGQMPDIVAGNVEQETSNTIEYIRRLGFTASDGLDIFVIVADGVRSMLEMNGIPYSELTIMTPVEAAEKLGLTNTAETTDRFGDVVFAMFFSSQRKRMMKLCTPYTEKTDKITSLIKTTKVITGVITLGAFAFSGYNAWQIVSAYSTTDKLETERSLKQQKLQKVKSEKHIVEDNPNALKEAVEMHQVLITKQHMILNLIGKHSMLTGFDAYVSELEVKVTKQKATSNTMGRRRMAPQMDGMGGPNGMPKETKPKAEPKAVNATFKITLSLPPDTPLEQTLDELDLFTGEIRQLFNKYEVKFSNLPSTKDLSVTSNLEDGASVQELTFSVNIIGPKPKEIKMQHNMDEGMFFDSGMRGF